MPKRLTDHNENVLDELFNRIENLERQMSAMGLHHKVLLGRVDTAAYPVGQDGQLALEKSSGAFKYYANNAWHAPGGGGFEIKVAPDAYGFTTGDGAFIFAIPADLNATTLTVAHAFVTTVSSSGLVTIQIRNITNGNADMLSTRITIDANEYTSYTAATPPVINTATDDVATGDRISIDIDTAGTGPKGLGVILGFG